MLNQWDCAEDEFPLIETTNRDRIREFSSIQVHYYSGVIDLRSKLVVRNIS
jgi:hypothetical protein